MHASGPKLSGQKTLTVKKTNLCSSTKTKDHQLLDCIGGPPCLGPPPGGPWGLPMSGIAPMGGRSPPPGGIIAPGGGPGKGRAPGGGRLPGGGPISPGGGGRRPGGGMEAAGAG